MLVFTCMYHVFNICYLTEFLQQFYKNDYSCLSMKKQRFRKFKSFVQVCISVELPEAGLFNSRMHAWALLIELVPRAGGLLSQNRDPSPVFTPPPSFHSFFSIDKQVNSEVLETYYFTPPSSIIF